MHSKGTVGYARVGLLKTITAAYWWWKAILHSWWKAIRQKSSRNHVHGWGNVLLT